MNGITDIYNDMAARTWAMMIGVLGIHTVTVLTQRTIWLTRQKHSGADAIIIDQDGISFSNLPDDIPPEEVSQLAEEFFSTLIEILTRLIGHQMAEKFAVEVDHVIGAAGRPS